jgi:Rrf2 family protein
LALTKKTDYALIALWHLAKAGANVVSAREVAETSGIPQPILTNILKNLAHAGLATSVRGAGGGYVLAREVDKISLHEVISVIEGPFQLVRCMHGNGDGACELEPRCPIRWPAFRVHNRLQEFLESVKLEELFRQDSLPVEIRAPRRVAAVS